MKIMVCHDGSEPAQRALEKTVELFSDFKAELFIVTVVEPPLDASSVDEDRYEEWRSKRDADLKAAAEWAASRGINVDAILAIGDPRRMILEAAESKAPDMLVVGKRGGGQVDKMVLGSVSAYIVRHAHCPVTVIQ
jgi:nucleotide-binding universal stress UspA family protein